MTPVLFDATLTPPTAQYAATAGNGQHTNQLRYAGSDSRPPWALDVLVVAVFSIAIYALAMSVRLTPEEVRRHVADAREEAEEVDEELAV
jgi:hypothetical protein